MTTAGQGRNLRPRRLFAVDLASLVDFREVGPALPVLETRRAELRPVRLGDHGAWATLREASRDHLTVWEPSWAPDDVTRSAFRRRARFHWRELQNGTGVPLLVFRRSDGALVGGASLINIRYGPSCSATIGYWIGAPFLRQGFGRAAVDALIDHAFTTLGLNRVEAACQPKNEASRRLLASAGFREEGLARDYLQINGVWRDHLLLALTAQDRLERAGDR